VIIFDVGIVTQLSGEFSHDQPVYCLQYNTTECQI